MNKETREGMNETGEPKNTGWKWRALWRATMGPVGQGAINAFRHEQVKISMLFDRSKSHLSWSCFCCFCNTVSTWICLAVIYFIMTQSNFRDVLVALRHFVFFYCEWLRWRNDCTSEDVFHICCRKKSSWKLECRQKHDPKYLPWSSSGIFFRMRRLQTRTRSQSCFSYGSSGGCIRYSTSKSETMSRNQSWWDSVSISSCCWATQIL